MQNLPFLEALIFVGGLAVGSFLNVVIYRLPRGKSLLRPGSACPSCRKPIRFYDNIPVLSFLLLKGRCRHCGEKISWRYPLVELLTATVFTLVVIVHGFSLQSLSYVLLTAMLIAITFIDLEHFIIPDYITIPGAILGLFLAFFSEHMTILNAVIGLLVGGVSLFLIALLGDKLFKRESMGGGDIKLSALLGAYLGWQQVIFVLVSASFFGAVIGVVGILLSKQVKKTRLIPFGPFLALGALVAIFFGQYLIDLYVNAFLR
jgi:leader peptidase (prepilin peptidase)/N-methyltransferase